MSTADGRQTTVICTKYQVPTAAGRQVRSMDAKRCGTTERLSTVNCGPLTKCTKYPPRQASKYEVWILNTVEPRLGCQQLTVDNWSTANRPQSTVNRGYSTLCLYNYNLLSTVDGEPLTK